MRKGKLLLDVIQYFIFSVCVICFLVFVLFNIIGREVQRQTVASNADRVKFYGAITK